VKVVFPVLAGLAVFAGVLLLRRYFPVRVQPELTVLPVAGEDDVVPPPEAEAAQALIAGACQGSDKFRVAWEGAVREAADYLTARIAGARMAGRTGVVRMDFRVPLFPGLDRDLTRVALAQAVQEEVNRRVEAMPHPGAFG
jgi:hypothetical protein